MLCFVFVSAYVLSFGTILVVGQCTISNCGVSNSGSEESLLKRLEEQDQKLQTMNEALSSAINKINEKLNALLDHVNENIQYVKPQVGHCRNTSVVCDCSEIKANGHTTSGVYRIYVDHQQKRYYANASCDMTTPGGGWTTFQRRKDGSEDFYRGWNDYAKGFGNPNGEFWLGNDFLYILTMKRRYQLRVDLEDFDGERRHAEYSTFNIGSPADKYMLTVGGYSGSAGDSLEYHNRQPFRTKDSDNGCAFRNQGAWWYDGCAHSNLNSRYLRGSYTSDCSSTCSEGIWWDRWRGHSYSLKTTEMKISSLAD